MVMPRLPWRTLWDRQSSAMKTICAKPQLVYTCEKCYCGIHRQLEIPN